LVETVLTSFGGVTVTSARLSGALGAGLLPPPAGWDDTWLIAPIRIALPVSIRDKGSLPVTYIAIAVPPARAAFAAMPPARAAYAFGHFLELFKDCP
jgi:hypothetical protein